MNKTQYHAQVAQTKKQVLSLLGWSEQQHADYMFEFGEQYLYAYIPADPDGINMLLRTRMYWNWWRNHWQNRDLVFISQNVFRLSKSTRIELYLSLHDPAVLAKEIRPNGVVLGNSYARMIGQLIDQNR